MHPAHPAFQELDSKRTQRSEGHAFATYEWISDSIQSNEEIISSKIAQESAREYLILPNLAM